MGFPFFFFSADAAQQFQYAVRVIGSNFAPTVERDEFLVAEKIKKERTCVSVYSFEGGNVLPHLPNTDYCCYCLPLRIL